MKLAIFWHDMLHYHAARIQGLVNAAEKMGHAVQAYILCSASGDLPNYGYAEELEKQINILSDDPSQAGEFSRQSKQHLLTELNAFNPDAVAIVGYTGPVSRAAVGWCRHHRRGAVLMLSSHADDYKRVWWKEWIKRRVVSLYDAAIVSGQRQAQYAQQLGLPTKRIRPMCNVVDNDFWSAEAANTRKQAELWHRHYNLPEQFFLTACRFIPKKNLSVLINVYANYVKQTETIQEANQWSLVIVGDGELAPILQQQVVDLNLSQRVHFAGYLPPSEMAKFYGLASAFVLASSYAEQWGLVVNEAMAARLPVLVSNICGCVPDLVIEGKTGYSFDPNNEAALAELFRTISCGSTDLAAMGQSAQEHIQHFSPATFATNLFKAAQLAIEHVQSRWWPVWPSPSFWP